MLTADTIIDAAIETTLDYEDAFQTVTDGISITVTATGEIAALGYMADGIYAVADGLTITNDGLITTSGRYADGIYAYGTGNSITNNGTISLLEYGGSAIASTGDDSVVVNTGTLECLLGPGVMVDIWGQNVSFDNSGTITDAGYQSLTIAMGGISASFTNSGSINATGDRASAVYFEGESFTNSGDISAGEGSVEAYNYETAQFTFDNSGNITGGSTALLLNHWHEGGPGVTSITNSGTLSSSSYTLDFWAEHGGTVAITNTASGLIQAVSGASSAIAAFIWSDTEAITLINQGDITASAVFDPDIPASYHWVAAIEAYSLTSISLSNSGLISAELTGVTPETMAGVQTIYLDVAVIDLQNSGTISNLSGGIAINLYATGASTLTNSGLIEGAVHFTSASAGLTLTNTGTIDGDVTLGNGADQLNTAGGEILGLIKLGAGDDAFTGGSGNETVVGGAGADALDGGAGIDTASYAGSSAGVRVDLYYGSGIGGDSEGDTLTAIENLTGSDHWDVLVGNGAGNILTGGRGNDLLWARGGDDTLYGDNGHDRLYGHGGNDTLTGGRGPDSLNGGAGNDTASYAGSPVGVRVDLYYGSGTGGDAEGDTLTGIENLTGSDFKDILLGNGGANILTGGAGNDVLWARGGDDTLYGEAGNDYLVGHSGNDTLDGGIGDDTLAGGSGADTLDGGSGSDTASYAGSSGGVRVDLYHGTGLYGDAHGDTLANIENLTGSDNRDTLLGNGGNNILTGGGGGDVLWARGGDDTLYGEAGNDYLVGHSGNDTLDGGIGDDTLAGGSGADTFVFDGSWGDDTVTDFEDGIDLLDFTGSGLTFGDLSISQSGSDTLVEDAFGNSITLSGITASDITADDFLFGG
jgi:Ca2+-binding RTX toxin-like protein